MARYLTDDDRPLLGWGDDRQKETVAILIVLTIIVFAAMWIAGFDNHAPPAPHCHSEDEVLLRVEDEAYRWSPGELVCVHVDQIHPTKEPA